MNYSDDTRYIITAEDRNGILDYCNRYIGLIYDSAGEIDDFAIFYTVDGYLDAHDIYHTEDEANKQLNRLKTKYKNTGNRRFNSLINLRVKRIVQAK